MRVRVLARDNLAGLTRDMHLVRDVLQAAGHAVECTGFGAGRARVALHATGLRLARHWRTPVDAQVFLERVHPSLLALAPRNFLVPNPEWFHLRWLRHLKHFSGVLCKTRHARPVFDAVGARTQYVGFTSDDRLDASVPRERAVLHVAGRSSAKGTRAVLEAWQRHPEWPRLTVIQRVAKGDGPVRADNIDHRLGHVDDAELRHLQNAHRFHLQPSEMEGFGHVLAEAMSTGNVVVTTDGAPMHELVSRRRGVLVAPQGVSLHGLSPRFEIQPEAIEAAMYSALTLDDESATTLGAAARTRYLDNDAAFRAALAAAVAG